MRVRYTKWYLHNSPSCPPGLANLQRDFSSVNVKNVLSLGSSVATELVWHRVKPGAIYLGPRVVAGIVARAKKQAADEGKGWISTGDILVAFFIKVIIEYSFLA